MDIDSALLVFYIFFSNQTDYKLKNKLNRTKLIQLNRFGGPNQFVPTPKCVVWKCLILEIWP